MRIQRVRYWKMALTPATARSIAEYVNSLWRVTPWLRSSMARRMTNGNKIQTPLLQNTQRAPIQKVDWYLRRYGNSGRRVLNIRLVDSRYQAVGYGRPAFGTEKSACRCCGQKQIPRCARDDKSKIRHSSATL